MLVPLKGKHGVILRSISIVKPSSWFSFLSQKPPWFKALILGSTSDKDRVKFWAGARQIEEMAFLTPAEEIAANFVPFKLHGDKGPYYKKKTLQVFSVSSILAHAADSTLSRLAICCFAAHVFFYFVKVRNISFFLFARNISFFSVCQGMLPGKFMVATSPTQAGTLDSILNYFADDLQTGFETVFCFVSFELLFDIARK